MRNIFTRLNLSYLYAFLGEATLSLTFIFYIILARVLGPEQYGIFASATALGGILAFFIQFGFPALLAREVAANPQEGSKSTLKFLLLEGLNSLLVLVFLLPLAYALGFRGIGLTVCYLVVLAEVCRSFKQTLRSVFRGLGKFRTETVSVALERLFVVLLASFVLLVSENLVWVITTLVFIRVLDILGLVYYLSKKTQISSSISLDNLWQSLRMAYPFAISAVLWILYYQIDILMIKALVTTEEAGFYSTAYRTIEIFSALPRVIFLVTFTKFARVHATEPQKLPKEIHQSTALLLAGILPVLFIAGLFQTTLIEILYGQAFSPAIQSLKILLPSLGIKMFGTLVEYFFQATGREKFLPHLLSATVIINLVCNAILIPTLGGFGAAIATLLSEVVLAIGGLCLMMYMGYRRIGQCLIVIALISLLIAGIPSLILQGLTPALAIWLILLGLATIIALMHPNYFLKKNDSIS